MTQPHARMRNHPLLACLMAAAAPILLQAPGAALAQSAAGESDAQIEEVTIIGKNQDVRKIPGSAHVIDAADIERFRYSDIHQLLRQAPGINIREEEGYGLRPNISIRGVDSERSHRITLMEDGVLIAPAPYAAPSAYYFPTAGRMSGIEVLKGPSAITEGPYNTGGVLNLLSTPIPEERQGAMKNELGDHSAWRTHIWYGGASGPFSGLVETHLYGTDGFKSIDKASDDTGFNKEDYLVKLRYEWETPGIEHALQLKMQASEEDSDQSYLGLTDEDFKDDPDRRYAPSQLDNFDAEHEQWTLTWSGRTNREDGLKWSATAYRNDFERKWYKTEGYYIDDKLTSDFDPERKSWSSVISFINAGIASDAAQGERDTYNEYKAALAGEDATTAGRYIGLRGNNREYFSQGIQAKAEWATVIAEAEHVLQFGIRWHEDEEDRFQPEDFYQMESGKLVKRDSLSRINSNRVQSAEATAIWVRDEIHSGDLIVTPGLRYEKVRQRREDWSKAENRSAKPSVRKNRTEVFLPGLGVTQIISPELAAFIGIHKGFAPAGNNPDVDDEESLNYEAGVRIGNEQSGWRLNVTGFYNDYDNLLGECTASTGGDCDPGDQFNGGKVEALGVEIDGGAALPWNLQADFAFTYTDSEFKTSFDSELFGKVEKGDELPYIPEMQGRVSLSWEGAFQGREADIQLAANYVDDACTSDCAGRTESLFTVDLKASVEAHPQVQLYAKVTNLFDERGIVARQPYGARPNRPATLLLGLNLDF